MQWALLLCGATFLFLFFVMKNKSRKELELLLSPLEEMVRRVEVEFRESDRQRTRDFIEIREQMRHLFQLEEISRKETHQLVDALKKPEVRGFWGEVQLQRLLETAGLIQHVDFFIQVTAEERALRPDVVIRLPEGRELLIDAKVPLDSFLHPNPSAALHAKQLRDQVQQLAKRNYPSLFPNSIDFVVLFLPAESLLSHALESDPALFEWSIRMSILIATPASLLALLKTVALVWKEEQRIVNSEEINRLGEELYKRLGDFSTHIATLSKQLNSTVETFNRLVGSYESRVLVTARKFEELGSYSSQRCLDPIQKIDQPLRTIIPKEEKELSP